jgi:N-acetylglucosaminyldiphosphoundecaprenol N-acetyl-beta-D-mannosaminyltransferase
VTRSLGGIRNGAVLTGRSETTAGGPHGRLVGPLGSERARVLGCELDRIDLDDAVSLCERVIESGGFVQHMAVNVAKVVAMRGDERLRESVARSELVAADGQAVVWASRLLGDPLPCRVAGIDLMEALFTCAAEKGYRVYVLGGRPEVLERAVMRMRGTVPNLDPVGYRHGYYEDAEEAEVAAAIAAARPDMLFVAMSSPRKEYFLGRYGRSMGVPFVMGVGGAIDVYAGVRRRAPRVAQQLGLEWLFRLAQEPRRLMKRYVKTNAVFVMLLSRELVKGRLARWHPMS